MTDLVSLIKKRGVVKGKLTRFQNFIADVQNGISSDASDANYQLKRELEIRVESNYDLIDKFNNLQ